MDYVMIRFEGTCILQQFSNFVETNFFAATKSDLIYPPLDLFI